MKRLRLVVSILAPLTMIALGLLAAPRSWAKEGDQGVLHAVAYGTLPAGRSLRVDVMENSDRNLTLKRQIERLLTVAGYVISTDAKLVLSFETRDDIGAYKSRQRRALVELQARGGSDSNERAKMLLNLYDSNTGGVFNQGKGETSIITRSKYRIDITIDDETSGRRLWHAWTVADIGRYDDRALGEAMAPVLIKSLGLSVKRRTFPLN